MSEEKKDCEITSTMNIIIILCLAMLSMHKLKAHAFPSPPYINAKFTHIYCLQSDWTFKDLIFGDIALLYVGVPTLFNLTFSYTGLTSGYLYTKCDYKEPSLSDEYLVSSVNRDLGSIWTICTNPNGYDTPGRYKIVFQLCWWDGNDISSTFNLDIRNVEVQVLQVSNDSNVTLLIVNVIGDIGQALDNAEIYISTEYVTSRDTWEHIDVYDDQAITGSISVTLPYGTYDVYVNYNDFNDYYYIELYYESLYVQGSDGQMTLTTGTTLTARLPVFLEIFGQIWTFTTFLLWMGLISTITVTPIGVLYKYRKRWSIHPMALCPRCGNKLEGREDAFWCQHCGWVAPSDVVRSRWSKYA